LPGSSSGKENTGELRFLVLKREVGMSRGLAAEIGNLPLHPDRPDPFFQKTGDPAGQLKDGKNFRLLARSSSGGNISNSLSLWLRWNGRLLAARQHGSHVESELQLPLVGSSHHVQESWARRPARSFSSLLGISTSSSSI